MQADGRTASRGFSNTYGAKVTPTFRKSTSKRTASSSEPGSTDSEVITRRDASRQTESTPSHRLRLDLERKGRKVGGSVSPPRALLVEREGNARVPPRYVEGDFKLGSWVDTQRQSYRARTLADNRKERLGRLPGWTWRPHSSSWEEGFSRLLRFVEREGHARVPQDYVENGLKLSVRVARQRRVYDQGTLEAERVQRLESVPGWSWDPFSDQWEAIFGLLMRYVEREGHAVYHSHTPRTEPSSGGGCTNSEPRIAWASFHRSVPSVWNPSRAGRGATPENKQWGELSRERCLVFDGMDAGEYQRVVFVEVKTGKASLSTRERGVRDAIEAGHVEYQLLRLPESLESVPAPDVPDVPPLPLSHDPVAGELCPNHSGDGWQRPAHFHQP